MVKINNSNKYDRHNKIKTIYKQSVIHKKKTKKPSFNFPVPHHPLQNCKKIFKSRSTVLRTQ